MFGLSLEKVLVVVLIATVLVDPTRLPAYTRRFAAFLRSLRTQLEAAGSRFEAETGVTREQWRALDLRQYDPRTIIRDALEASPATPDSSAPASAPDADDLVLAAADAAPSAETARARLHPVLSDEELARIRPGQRYLVVGDSAHPVRVAIAALPEDHPARTAAQHPPVGTREDAVAGTPI